MDDRTKTALHWPDLIYAQLRRVGIRQVGYVPDAGHSRLIELCVNDPDIHDVVLTTEDEGVGLVAGAALGGERAALLMQLHVRGFVRVRLHWPDLGFLPEYCIAANDVKGQEPPPAVQDDQSVSSKNFP